MNNLKRLRPSLTLSYLILPALLMLPACGDSSSDAGADSDGFSTDGSGSESGEAGWGDEGSSTGASDDSASGDATSGTSTGGDTGTGDTDGGFDSGEDTGADGEATGDGDGDGDGDGEACDLEEAVTLYLSPDDSNSMSSPAQVKQVVDGTGIPSLNAVSIRPWEFMNYYNFDYTPAAQSELALTVEMVDGEAEGQFRMQIAVASESMTQAQRPPMNITLVLDTSGSMGGQPMEHLKETSRAIAASLKPGDIVSLLEWDTDSSFSLAGYPVSGPNDATLLEKIEELSAGGGTDLSGGLTTGYELAQSSFDASFINRLVLISDGGANVGVTDADIIGMHAGTAGADGIYMVGVGVSDSSYDDHLMDTVTDLGKGASVFVGSDADAWQMFNQNFVNTMAIAARDVQVKLDMPPGFDIVKFSGEEFGGDPTEIEPQHISPNDAMVFHQVIENCDPDSVSLDQEITVTAIYQDAWTFENKQVTTTHTLAELLGLESPQLHKGRAILAYAEALQAIKSDPANREAMVADAHAQIDYALTLLPADADLVEIDGLLTYFE